MWIWNLRCNHVTWILLSDRLEILINNHWNGQMQIKKSQNNKNYATSPLGWDTDQVQCPVRGLGPKCSITCQRPDEEHYFESIKLIFAQLYMDELTSWSGRGGGGGNGGGGVLRLWRKEGTVSSGQHAHLMAPLLSPVAITLTDIPSGAAENSKQLIKYSQEAWPMNLPLTVHSLITLPSSIVLSSDTYFTII